MASRKVMMFLVAAAAGGCATDSSESQNTQPITAGATYTTFVDPAQCVGGSVVNCNNYASKAGVWLSGGPTNGAYNLSDGDYFFAVLVPGTQNGGFVDYADGNLSSPHDTADARKFSIANHVISYSGPHATYQQPDGKTLVQLIDYDDTTNNGGVYILAVCKWGTTSPSDCKYDAFRVTSGGGGPTCTDFAVATGEKYYDANRDGQLDNGELGIAGWRIDFHDQVGDTLVTAADGTFTTTLLADTYNFWEEPALGTIQLQQGGTIPVWWQSGNTVDQTAVTGDASATLNSDMTYTIRVTDCSIVTGIFFGNFCVGKGGGLTLGFWSNKNGQALISGADLASLDALHLVNAAGNNFDPTTKSQVRTWLLNATATNMAYMLSAQLATMELNVSHGFVSLSSLIYAPGILPGETWLTVGQVITLADDSLAAHPYTVSAGADRTYQEALKNALDNANNDKTFVEPDAAHCPAPVFTAASNI